MALPKLTLPQTILAVRLLSLIADAEQPVQLQPALSNAAAYRQQVDAAVERGLVFLTNVQEGKVAENVAGSKPKPKLKAEPPPKRKGRAAANREGRQKNPPIAERQAPPPKPVAPGVVDGSISDKFILRSDPGMTSLCALAFLSKDHKPGQGPHGKTINAALDFVLSQQSQNGLIEAAKPYTTGRPMYGHCVATLFLAEASAHADAERTARINKALLPAIAVISI